MSGHKGTSNKNTMFPFNHEARCCLLAWVKWCDAFDLTPCSSVKHSQQDIRDEMAKDKPLQATLMWEVVWLPLLLLWGCELKKGTWLGGSWDIISLSHHIHKEIKETRTFLLFPYLFLSLVTFFHDLKSCLLKVSFKTLWESFWCLNLLLYMGIYLHYLLSLTNSIR